MDNQRLLELLEEALDARRTLKVYLDSEEPEFERQREVISRMVISLSNISSLYVNNNRGDERLKR